jgi:ATP-dependent protease ClpP protease subunit
MNFCVSGEIDSKMFKEFCDWCSEEHVGTRTVIVNSFGGSIACAIAMADMIMSLKMRTIGAGVVYSAAVPVFLAGDVRKMYPSCMIYDHESYSGDLNGGTQEIRNELALVDGWSAKLRKMYSERTKLTGNEIDQMFSRDGWVCDAQKALELGICHEVIS